MMFFNNRNGFVPGVIQTPQEMCTGALPDWALTAPASAAPNNDWFEEVTSTRPQAPPSCVGRATAQLLMCVIRRQFGKDAIPAGSLIDGDSIWRSRRKRRYGGDLSGGLQMPEGLQEAALMGIFGPIRYGIASVQPTISNIERLLAHGPVLIGVATHPAWSNADRRNGQIPNGRPNPNLGHALMIADIQRAQGTHYVRGPNSWGLDWGYNGMFCLTEGQFTQSVISSAVALYLPDGIGETWRNFLVRSV